MNVARVFIQANPGEFGGLFFPALFQKILGCVVPIKVDSRRSVAGTEELQLEPFVPRERFGPVVVPVLPVPVVPPLSSTTARVPLALIPRGLLPAVVGRRRAAVAPVAPASAISAAAIAAPAASAAKIRNSFMAVSRRMRQKRVCIHEPGENRSWNSEG